MKSNARKSVIVAAAVASVAAFSGSPAGAVLIDNFSGNLSAYTQSRVLDNNTTPDISFSNSTGDVRSSYASGTTNAAEQNLLLRGDVSVPVGQTYFADVNGWSADTGYDRDLGIAIGYTATPATVPAASTGDARSSYVEVSIRSNNQVVSFARDGSTNLASGQVFTGQGTPALNTTDPIQLYIAHKSANVFDVGFYQDGVQQQIQEYTFTSANVPGAAIGIYTDLRAPLASTPVGIDNLQIASAVPEPASVALLGLGGLALLRRRRP